MKLKHLLFGGLALAMASCADDAINNGNGNVNDPTLPLSTAKYTVGGGDQSRAINFASTGGNTRSISGFQMPDYPTIPSEAVDVTGYDEEALRNAGPVIKITGRHTNKINSWNDQTLYIAPGADVECAIEGNLEVYILTDAKFKFTGNNLSSIKGIYNWGDFTTSGDFSLNSYPFYSAVQVEFPGTLTFPTGAQYYCKEETVAKKLYVNSGAKVESCAFIVGDEANYPTPDAWGNIAWDAESVIEFGGGNLDFHTSYIQAGYIKFNSNNNLHLSLEDNGRIDTKYLQIDIKQNDQKIVTLGSKAVVCAKEIFLQQNFQSNEEKLLPNFGLGVAVQDVQYIHENGNNNNPSDYDISTAGGINNPDFSMESANCSPGYGDSTDPEKNPSLDLVADIKSPTHDHDVDKNDPNRRHLSATSITFDVNTNNIYASYHMRGGNWGNDTYDKDDIEGCIERWTLNDDGVEIGNWMWTYEFDFNHIILDGNYVITVGHKGGDKEIVGENGQKYTDFGGIIGRMPAAIWSQNWDADQVLTREDFAYKYLTTEVPLYADFENESGNVTNQKVDYQSAGDGNCVVRYGDNYFVATSAGYGIIKAEDFSRIKDAEGNVLFTSTKGSAKYLVENDGVVNVLYLNDRATGGSTATTSFGATLATMNSQNFPKGEVTTKGMAANVSPVDGKNVIAVNNGVVYACLSKGGLQIGEDVITFTDEEDGSRSVNGVTVDDQYIYVANGSYLTVLDKATHKVVVERKGKTNNVSANFVEVKELNGTKYIFVAFGQDGIKVFKFNEGK